MESRDLYYQFIKLRFLRRLSYHYIITRIEFKLLFEVYESILQIIIIILVI